MSAIPDRTSVPPLRPVPSGTVTFAFTDIEGSTARWDRDPAAMQDALRRHDALLHSVIAGRGGYVFKTIGDAFCAAFVLPADAARAMLDAQCALDAEDFSAAGGIRIRAAIHTGTADEREGDYFGPVVNRVARLLSIAHGGQVIVSGTTAGLIDAALPANASLRDLGEHRLKDLARSERVYQLLAPGLPADFPPLRSLDARRNNLPVAVTSFVGRETEVTEISALLEHGRLVTVAGSGGIGKTRAVLQVAANLIDTVPDGVWLIELAPLRNADYLATTVAQALGLSLPSHGDALAHLTEALRTTSAMLVFDNCEHLVEAAAHAIAALLRHCPQLKLIATSRQVLGIAGEAAYRMRSLGVPDIASAAAFTPADVALHAATELFAERARAVDQRFAVTAENAPAIADICRRLDGIPLALELAAARVTMLSPQQLRDRLDERFRVLTSGSRDLLPRQQTLRALIDWSHDLLSEPERVLFRRLAIFANGFTLEGASAVAGGEDLDEFAVFDALASLVDKSLVLAEPDGESLRYRLLESTRVYAHEKLAAAGETAGCAVRHLHYVRDHLGNERSTGGSNLEAALVAELEDIRAALDWALTGPDMRAGAELMECLFGTWGIVGLYLEGMTRIEAFLAALPETESRLRTHLWAALASLAANQGGTARAAEAAGHAVACARASGDGETLAVALASYAWSSIRVGNADVAVAALAEADAIPGVSAGTRRRLLESRALVSSMRGDLASAAHALEQVRREYRERGDRAQEFSMTLNLAELEHLRGRTSLAIALVIEVLPSIRDIADRNGLVQMLGNLAGYRAAVDDLAGACEAAREAIAEFADRELQVAFVAVAIEHLALALALAGDLPRAAVLAGYAEAAIVGHGYEREFTERTSHDRLMAVLRDSFTAEELTARLSEGAELTPQAAVAQALASPPERLRAPSAD